MDFIKHEAQKNTNIALGDMLHTIASCYRYLGSEYRSMVMAYTAAARTIHGLSLDVATYYSKKPDALNKLRGVDDNIAREIIEYLKTGTIKVFEKLKKKVPMELLELMDVRGFGPATVKAIHEKLHINNREEMKTALLSGRLTAFEGFGKNKIEQMKRGLKLFREIHTQLPLGEALAIGNNVLKQLQALPGVKEAVICGSLRRKKNAIAGIDIVATASRNYWEKIIQAFCDLPFVNRIIAAGGRRISVLLKNHHVQIDIQLVHEHEYGAAVLYFTGSREHNIRLNAWAEKKGLRLQEYGVYEIKTGKCIPAKTEEEIYDLLGLQYIPPELREGRGEVEKAARHRLPKLVEDKDICGDMQVRSSWSTGEDDIDTIARQVLKLYPQYEYIIITDPSFSQPGANGLKPQDFIDQFAEIDAVNKALGRPFVKKGVEVQIHEDGSLNLPYDLLQQFEWVTASIVSGWERDNTARLIKACEDPQVHCINYTSGVLRGKEEAGAVNWNMLIEKAAITGTCMSINAQPHRPGLKDELVKAAVEKGVKICIGTAARDLDEFDFMQAGVAVARRGWCTKEKIMNTCSWKEVDYYKQYKQNIIKQVDYH